MTVSEPRTRCICGATVLPENAANHLERRSNGPHKIVEWPTPTTRAGRTLYESLEVMGPSHQELAAAILAIEAEAAQPIDLGEDASRENVEAFKKQWQAMRAEAAQPIDVERLRRAYCLVKHGGEHEHCDSWTVGAVAAEYARLSEEEGQ